MPLPRIWLLGTAILGAEVLARLPLGFRAPELLLYPVLLLVASRHDRRTALAGSLLVAIYLGYFFWRFEALSLTSPAGAWRLGVLALALGAAAALGHLSEHVNRLRGREREAKAAAETAWDRTNRILESIPDGFVMLDASWRFTYVNRAAQVLLRRPREELLGKEARSVFPPSLYLDFYRKYQQSAREKAPIRFEASTPTDLWIEVHAAPFADGVAMYFRDVTERRQHEEKLRSMTLIDELTGLYNRRGFFTLAEQQCKIAERKGRSLLLVFADLDDLKRINDTHGHIAGDQALFEAAAILQHTFRETDVVARIGGDEFAALVLETEPDTAPAMLSRLEANVRQANDEGTLPFELSLSFGIASFDPAAATPIDELLSLADHRMYEQKRSRRRKG